MDKFKKVIQRYETARQLVSTLKEKRRLLIAECESTDLIPCPSGYGEVETGKLCLTSAFNELMETIEENGPGYDYEETLQIMHAENRCCDHCYESYGIKVGPLAEARKEFGNAKRQISRIGKELIKLEH